MKLLVIGKNGQVARSLVERAAASHDVEVRALADRPGAALWYAMSWAEGVVGGG